jgi:hypothetical protein
MFYVMKGNPLLKFLAAVAGVDPTMPGAASDEASTPSKSAKDSRASIVTKGPLAGRKRAPATPAAATARRARAR